MLLRKEPPFVKLLGAGWSAINHLQSCKALEMKTSDSVIVAFDLEGWAASVNEIGLAILHMAHATSLVPFEGSNLDAFETENKIEVHTVSISERVRHPRAPRYGDQKVIWEADAEKALQQIMSTLKQKSCNLILMGYNMYTEFSWIAQLCPSFLLYFDHWVDIQELVEERCGCHPSLAKLMACLEGQNPEDIRRNGHRAAVDAVKILAVASRFIGGKDVNYRAAISTKPKLHSRTPRNWDKVAFRARITAVGGSLLPAQITTPQQLASHFVAYDLKAVFIDERMTVSERSHAWWISVDTQASLDALAIDYHCRLFHGQELLVEKIIAPWVGASYTKKRKC